MGERSAIAIGAHPDDIEFAMAGTLCLLREAGYQTHYLNVSSGSCGSTVYAATALRKIRRTEARQAAALLGATFHESRTDDLEIFYSLPLLRWLAGVIRRVRPSIVLTHSPADYMEDHMNTCRLVITAAFAHDIPNFRTTPHASAWVGDVTVYHAMPHGLRDPLRRRVIPGGFVNTTSVQAKKLAALARHKSQQRWLETTQGMNSYLRTMQSMSHELGRMSGRFRFAEGWRRHLHLGFSAEDIDPLREALGRKYLSNRAYENGLERG